MVPCCGERLSWRDLSSAAELGGARLSQTHLLQRGRQRRALCGLGTTATLFAGGPRGLSASADVVTRRTVMPHAHQPGQAVFRSILPEDIDWKPFPAFPPEARLATLVGHPSEPGPYVIRVKVPAGTKLIGSIRSCRACSTSSRRSV